MPAIRGSNDLIENFQEIVDFCEENREPVFITENGRGKLAVMSMGTYEETVGKIELYNAIEAGLNQIKNGETITKEELFEDLNNLIGK
ncbi:MAG: type II toxin-antitoxin system Phd/YefM family antitoxin [Treponema sp.]|jgi:PHD/YefM family antitoxin component YafN of YafNO toxin-antitoxin module|nr:type II toxin-antitoxin system Phd/YefM family antitoxin [Treponema sp.]